MVVAKHSQNLATLLHYYLLVKQYFFICRPGVHYFKISVNHRHISTFRKSPQPSAPNRPLPCRIRGAYLDQTREMPMSTAREIAQKKATTARSLTETGEQKHPTKRGQQRGACAGPPRHPQRRRSLISLAHTTDCFLVDPASEDWCCTRDDAFRGAPDARLPPPPPPPPIRRRRRAEYWPGKTVSCAARTPPAAPADRRSRGARGAARRRGVAGRTGGGCGASRFSGVLAFFVFNVLEYSSG